MDNQFQVITISHQLGSGGAYLGKKLSKHLSLPFIDRDVVKRVADQLQLAEEALDGREERLSTFWQSFMRVAVFTDPAECLAQEGYFPSDRELFDLESAVIREIAEKNSAVFFGRCGRYILRDHPNHFHILVHANLPERTQRIQQLYCLGAEDAKKMIENNDKERTAYMHVFTGQDWLDARLYDLCINTSSLGLDKAVEICLAAIKEKAVA